MTDTAGITSEHGVGAPMEGRKPAVRIIELTKEFPGGVRALGGVSFDVPRGELTSIIGPSGCGKTTTLKIIAGLVDATSGQVEVSGVSVTTPGPDRALVFPGFRPDALGHRAAQRGLRPGASWRAPPGARSDRA